MRASIMMLTVLAAATAWSTGAAQVQDSAAQVQDSAAQVQDSAAQVQDDAALVVRGDSVYHGKLGGAICATCHGQDAKGLAGMGPDLTDKVWLHGDGGVKFIETIIRTGVTKPKKSSVAMPPFGGVPLDSAKTVAVAAYIHFLGAPK